jgi:DNA uptake protein ComE-like DNA-binding protein
MVVPITYREGAMRMNRIGWGIALALALGLIAGVAVAEDRAGKDGGPKPGVAKADGKVNINEASRTQLMKLSGIGPGTADRMQDLEKVDGVGKGVIERNEGRMAVK